MASTAITIKGNVANISQPDAQRLAAFVLRCNHIVISSAVQADGSFRLSCRAPLCRNKVRTG